MLNFDSAVTGSIVSRSGITLIGQAIKRHMKLTREIDVEAPLRPGIKHFDVVKIHLSLLCLGKNDFDAVSIHRQRVLFHGNHGYR